MLERADLSSPAERDRALAELAPVLAEMGESVSREELVRRVAGRLDVDPAMVIGRIASARERGTSPASCRAPSTGSAAPPKGL